MPAIHIQGNIPFSKIFFIGATNPEREIMDANYADDNDARHTASRRSEPSVQTGLLQSHPASCRQKISGNKRQPDQCGRVSLNIEVQNSTRINGETKPE